MSKTFAVLAVSFALVAIGAPVNAADMNGGGKGSIKDGMGGAAVPAPVPYEEHYKYYVGAGIGWTMRAKGDIDLSAGGVAGGLPFDDQDRFKGPFGVSLFAGRYITPTLRTELGLDLRQEQKRQRTIAYTASLSSTQDFGGTIHPVTNTYTMERDEDVRIRNHTAMFNVYYDMNRGGRFNPYIGAGIGISYKHFGRASSETILSCEGSEDPTAPGSGPAACWNGTSPTQMPTGTDATSFTSAQAGWGLAAALMAGVTYNISERTHLDMGYRLIYQGSKALVSSSSLGYCNGCGNAFTGMSVMNVGSRVDHELRASLRWDLW